MNRFGFISIATKRSEVGQYNVIHYSGKYVNHHLLMAYGLLEGNNSGHWRCHYTAPWSCAPLMHCHLLPLVVPLPKREKNYMLCSQLFPPCPSIPELPNDEPAHNYWCFPNYVADSSLTDAIFRSTHETRPPLGSIRHQGRTPWTSASRCLLQSNIWYPIWIATAVGYTVLTFITCVELFI